MVYTIPDVLEIQFQNKNKSRKPET